MELELKHLKGYLDHGLKGVKCAGAPVYYLHSLSKDKFLWKPFYTKGEINGRLLDRIDCKPLLYPLSSLTKEIEHDGERFVPIERINKDGCLSIEHGVNGYGKDYLLFIYADGDDSISFSEFENVIEKLYEWHFNVHNLPDHLFIDKSTVKI